MTSIHRAADRFVTEQPGITTHHSFSAGAHYDASNISFGRVVGVDEHIVDAGAGFDWHTHRGVTIVSWVLEGTLRHEDSNGAVHVVRPAELLVQDTREGIRHAETNASESEALRFVQTTLLGDDPPPFTIVRTSSPVSEGAHVYVARGSWRLGDSVLTEGDSVRADALIRIDGSGELLVVRGVPVVPSMEA